VVRGSTVLAAVATRGWPKEPRRVSENSRDGALAARLVSGDEAALREVYREHVAAVNGLAVRVLSNEALAEEVVQDVFVRLWEHPERFDPSRGRLRAFLLAMTHSRAVERVRREESLRRRHAAAQREPVDVADDPARVTESREVEQAVRSALAELPDVQRVPIEMAYFDGLSYRQVAVELGEAEGTVKYRIRVGMQKLRAALQTTRATP
jgi:RNA polymerase sigma-70 factor (ECF subfamily)